MSGSVTRGRRVLEDARPCEGLNCQHQCWAFDRMLDHARENDVYIQLCIDPYPPIIAYEDILWAGHAYSLSYLEPNRDQATGRFDMKEFFYTPHPDTGAPMHDEGVFYYWKRKYKYIMSRWGYSLNLPIIEPFNEIDQMLTYRYANLTQSAGKCNENRLVWPEDPDLPETLDSWLTDITGYVRGDVDLNNPVASPLGENRLFLASYTDAELATTSDPDYFLPFENENVDLIDVHKGLKEQWDVRASYDDGEAYHDNFISDGNKKPFHRGEYSTFGPKVLPGALEAKDTYPFFANYDISFHNEIWASAFYGNFAAGSSWAWERVFWWPDALQAPLPDEIDNPDQIQTPPTSVPGQPNVMFISGLGSIQVTNKPVHHHFKQLSGLLNHPNWQAYDFFGGDFSVHRHTYNPNNPNDPNTDEAKRIECYWLLREPTKDLAIGWVHNMNAYWDNSWYMRAGAQNHNMLGCAGPNTQTITLNGFAADNTYHVTYIPTRMDTDVAPDDQEDDDLGTTVTLDLSTEPLSGTIGTLLDTLHSDYAFIIATEPFVKSLPLSPMQGSIATVAEGWDFSVYPNPAHDAIHVLLPDDGQRDIVLLDLLGRQIAGWHNVGGPLETLPISQLARGSYWVRVSDGVSIRTKKLTVQ